MSRKVRNSGGFSVRRYSTKLRDNSEYIENNTRYMRDNTFSMDCDTRHIRNYAISIRHAANPHWANDSDRFKLDAYERVEHNIMTTNTNSGIVLNLDNTRLGDPRSQTIINAYHVPGANIFDHYTFVGDVSLKNVYASFKEHFDASIIESEVSDHGFIITLAPTSGTNIPHTIIVDGGTDDEDNSGKRIKDFADYTIYVFSDYAYTLNVRSFIKTITYNRNESYFGVEAYHYHKPNDDVLYNTIHIDKRKYENIIDNIHPRIDIHDMIDAYLESSENILILFGEPGTGKTTLIKQIMLEYAKSTKHNPVIIYTKDTEVLRKDVFWNMILEREPDLLILDDFDKELENRNNDKHEENSIVNKILSVSDGLFHSKTKIIVTTNMSHTDIDPAIVRPGRCFDIIQIPSLSLEEAKKIWIDTLKQSQESFTESFAGYDSIKQAFLMSEYDKYRFANKTYLKDPSISVRGSYVGNKKTFGFTP